MRDLGDAVLTWDDRLDGRRRRRMVDRPGARRLHRAYLGDPPADLAPLARVLELFAPHRIGALRRGGQRAVPGWRCGAGSCSQERVASDVAQPRRCDSWPMSARWPTRCFAGRSRCSTATWRP